MKKFLLISASGILVGGIFALYMFKNIETDVLAVISSDTKVTAFQAGVFSVYDNAVKMQANYKNSYIYQEGNRYRVIIAVYKDSEIINKMQKYYQDNNEDIYLKEINDTNAFIDELNKYESLLKETEDIDTYINANKNILEAFSNYIWHI